MKKINVYVLSAAIATATLAVSCQGGGSVNTEVSLKTEMDSLSYAYGASMIETGLKQAVEQQFGIITDTTTFRMMYLQKMSSETDTVRKLAMEKELPAKLDSVKRANARNLDSFIKGLNQSLNSTNENDVPYNTGLSVGTQLSRMVETYETSMLEPGQKFDRRVMVAAIAKSLKSNAPVMENAQAMVQKRAADKQEADAKKQEEEMKVQFADKIAEGNKFLEENKAKEGVVALPSGLQYKIIKEGNGEKPKASDKVNVTYKGTLIDGTEFDSGTTSFGVEQVIKGWTEALQLMPVGSKWELYIPYDLGYGARQAGQHITPFSTLVFEVELLGIEK